MYPIGTRSLETNTRHSASLATVRRALGIQLFAMGIGIRGVVAQSVFEAVKFDVGMLHFRILRTDPEPTVQPEVDGVRRALARLIGEPERQEQTRTHDHLPPPPMRCLRPALTSAS